jgi:acyl-CoA reductase-like NAD-dependent aldehyde dehydrogenase
MGGNDPAIIRSDVDVKQVAPEVFAGAFSNTGQICCAVKRCFVHESIYDEFVEEIAKSGELALAPSPPAPLFWLGCRVDCEFSMQHVCAGHAN